jgi:signal transduction histidine kinase
MMERAEMLGGFTALAPRDGRGTTVTVSIPLNRKIMSPA